MSIRYEQVLPGQGEFFAYLAAPDIISRLDRGDLTGIAAISGTDEADTPAGLAGISKEDDGTLRLDWLYVDRDHRGKGIGKRLLELTLRIAARNGAAYVVARIYPGIMEEPLFSGDMISFIRSIWKAGIKEREALWMLSKRELMTEDFVHKAATRLESMPGRVYAFKELPESTLRSILAPLGAAGELKGDADRSLSFAFESEEGWEGVIITGKYGDVYEPRLFPENNSRRLLKLLFGLTLGLVEKMKGEDYLRVREDQHGLVEWMDRLVLNADRQKVMLLEAKVD